MKKKSLYQRYQPVNWDEIVGHKRVVAELRSRAIDNNWSQALYFCGKSGVGKCLTGNTQVTIKVGSLLSKKLEEIRLRNEKEK